MLLPVLLAKNPEGLEDNYAKLMDNMIGSRQSHTRWKNKEWYRKREIQPFGHQDINDCWGHPEPDTTLI